MTGVLLEFKAWIDEIHPVLIVVGQVEFPSINWRAGLKRADQQGSDPLVIVLDLKVERRDEHTGVRQNQDRQPVRYEENPAERMYTHATIRYGQDTITVAVMRTS